MLLEREMMNFMNINIIILVIIFLFILINFKKVENIQFMLLLIILKYNVMLVHGTYESGKGIENCSSETPEAVKESKKADFRPPLL